MHARTFHWLCASAFALVALAGAILATQAHSHADAHGLLLAVLFAIAFAVTAWLQPAPSSLCRACRTPKGAGFDFCILCGAGGTPDGP